MNKIKHKLIILFSRDFANFIAHRYYRLSVNKNDVWSDPGIAIDVKLETWSEELDRRWSICAWNKENAFNLQVKTKGRREVMLDNSPEKASEKIE